MYIYILYICIYIYVYIYIGIYIYMCIYICVYIYICIYICFTCNTAIVHYICIYIYISYKHVSIQIPKQTAPMPTRFQAASGHGRPSADGEASKGGGSSELGGHTKNGGFINGKSHEHPMKMMDFGVAPSKMVMFQKWSNGDWIIFVCGNIMR